MQVAIARFDAERTRTLAAVGHDLRTAVASLRIRARMLDDEQREPMVHTLDEMRVMADGPVAYARGDGGSETRKRIALGAFLERLSSNGSARSAVQSGPADVEPNRDERPCGSAVLLSFHSRRSDVASLRDMPTSSGWG